MLYNDTLAPEVWRLNAGSTLAIKLVNRLDAGTVEDLQGLGAGPRTMAALRELSHPFGPCSPLIV